MKKMKTKQQRHIEGWHEQNRFYKRMGIPKVTFEEYMDYIHGRLGKVNKRTFTIYKPSEKILADRARTQAHREKYPSVQTVISVDATARKEPQMYTGTLIKGIATMHKSNAVPVIDDKQAKEIASMRR